jgi:hypothetical protein
VQDRLEPFAVAIGAAPEPAQARRWFVLQLHQRRTGGKQAAQTVIVDTGNGHGIGRGLGSGRAPGQSDGSASQSQRQEQRQRTKRSGH